MRQKSPDLGFILSTKYVFAAKFNDFASKISPLIFNDLVAILNDLAANLFQIRR